MDKLKVKWNDFDKNIGEAFRELRIEEDFFDVTLACDEDDQIQAHKVILSAGSPFFRSILKKHPHSHPLLYLKGIKGSHLASIVRFMYDGEVDVEQEELSDFLEAAEELSVKGLTHANSVSSVLQKTTKRKPTSSPDPGTRPVKRQKPGRHRRHHRGEEDHIKEELYADEEFNGLDCGEQEDEAEADIPPGIEERTGSFDEEEIVLEPEYTLANAPNPRPADQDSSISEYNGMLEEAMRTSISKLEAGAYNCLLCDKVCRDLTRARQHLEAKHFPSVGYTCSICDKHCKTKHALTCHLSVYHRDVPKVGL